MVPEQTLATRMPRLATAFTKFVVHVLRAAASMPSPPAMSKVVSAPGEPNLRASISAPEVLRTGPGSAAIRRIGTCLFASRLAISNTEIGPAASSNWKSGKISTPIMDLASWRKLRDISHFGQETTMSNWAGQAQFGGPHDHAASDWNSPLPEGHPARFHGSAAGVFQRTRRQGASDLEAHRTGRERLRDDADADHDLRRLPAARQIGRAHV